MITPDRPDVLTLAKRRLAAQQLIPEMHLAEGNLRAEARVDHALRCLAINLEATLWGRVVRHEVAGERLTRRDPPDRLKTIESRPFPRTWWDHLKRDVVRPLLRAWFDAVEDDMRMVRPDSWPVADWLLRAVKPRYNEVPIRTFERVVEHVHETHVEEWHLCPHVVGAPSSMHLRFLSPCGGDGGDVERHRREHAFAAAARYARVCLDEARQDPYLRHALGRPDAPGRFADALDAMAHYVEQAGP